MVTAVTTAVTAAATMAETTTIITAAITAAVIMQELIRLPRTAVPQHLQLTALTVL